MAAMQGALAELVGLEAESPGGIGGGATDGGDTGSFGRIGKSGDGEDGGGSLDGGIAWQDRGERRISPSGSESHNFLVLLAGREAISGGEGGDGARLGGDMDPPAGAVSAGLVDWALPTAVAARLCLQQRR
jgi:hypothetical protein